MQNAIVKCTDRLILWICVPHTAAACGNVCFSTSSISGIVRAAVSENITTTATTKWLSGFCLNSVRKRCMCLSETECVHHDATQLRTIHPSITLANNIVSFTHLLHTISILLIHRSFYRVCMAMLVARTLFVIRIAFTCVLCFRWSLLLLLLCIRIRYVCFRFAIVCKCKRNPCPYQMLHAYVYNTIESNAFCSIACCLLFVIASGSDWRILFPSSQRRLSVCDVTRSPMLQRTTQV